MERKEYSLDKNGDNYIYTFDSEGPKGRIRKIIGFRQKRWLGTNMYNLVFGDFNKTRDEKWLTFERGIKKETMIKFSEEPNLFPDRLPERTRQD